MDTQNENLEPKARLSLAQWTLDKNLGWIAASEVKSGFTFAVAASMLGLLYGQAAMACTTQTLIVGGKMTVCTVCGTVVSCM